MAKPIKSITNEAWISKDSQNFYGKKMLVFVDRNTGKQMTFVLQEEMTDERLKFDGGLETEEYLGCNGFHKATWQNLLLDNQTKEEN